jgi:hypothetical protein
MRHVFFADFRRAFKSRIDFGTSIHIADPEHCAVWLVQQTNNAAVLFNHAGFHLRAIAGNPRNTITDAFSSPPGLLCHWRYPYPLLTVFGASRSRMEQLKVVNHEKVHSICWNVLQTKSEKKGAGRMGF